MQFCEKLDFLMSIANTTNSALARATALDASHISRLRRGQRSLSKNETYLKSMAVYFARHCVEDYQRKALYDALNAGPVSFDDNKLSELILNWFSDETVRKKDTVENFLNEFSAMKIKKNAPNPDFGKNNEIVFPQTETAVYYGIDGKRQAVIYFLSEVIARDKPQTLLLFSDEATDWMAADHEFAAKWAFLMFQTLAKGNKIKIIHTVSRELDEMLNAISQWMPLYMSGTIEPYFYPKKRDGVFKRTLFIAPETAAVISSSVGGMYRLAANILFRNEKAVASFAEEFKQYLDLCRPLMRIFTAKDKEAYMETLSEFEKEQADTIIKTESISMLTMPETLVAEIIARPSCEKIDFLDYHKTRLQNFRRNIRSSSFTEIIQLPDIETVKKGKVKIAFSDVLSGGDAFYTAEEYILHLENLVHLLETYENFHVHVLNNIKEDRYMVYAREDLGAIVAKTSLPPVALAMNEDNMTAAFWDFLMSIVGKKNYDNPNNNGAANKLRSYIRQISFMLMAN